MNQRPSWLLWPPNCCETCQSWQRKSKVTTIEGDVMSDFIGVCNSPISLDSGTVTDSRYRCPSFKRRQIQSGADL